MRVYGRYGKFCQRRAKGEKSPALLEEAQVIVNEAKSVGFDLREHDYFMHRLEDAVDTLKETLVRESNHTVPKPRPEPPAKEPTPKSRISLEPIELRLANAGPNGKPRMDRFRPMAAGLDALWTRGAVLFMPRQGELVQVLADEKLGVADVVYDGRYVWVASFNDWGLSVLDRDGRELARIGREDGLPPCNPFGLVAHPIEPGRVMVAGNFGNERRGWIAMVRFDGSKGTVQVIHEATKVRDYKDPDDHYSTDPAKTFSPEAVIEHVIPGPKPRRILMILRNRGQPLMVDPESGKVWVYPANPTNTKWFPRHAPPAHAFLSIDGVLWVGGMDDFISVRLNEGTGLFDGVRERDNWHAGTSETGSLCRDGDWLYYAGYKWRRLNLKSGEEELLVEGSRALPHFGSGGAWHLAISNHYGLVAFFPDKGELYRVKVTP